MSDRQLSIRISATEDASRTFKVVGDSAKTMGEAVEAAGAESSASFDEAASSAGEMGSAIDQAGKQGSASLKAMSKDAKDVAAAMGTVGKTIAGFGATMLASVAVPIAAGSKAAWDQVDAVQQATIALRTYEKDASKVDKVLQSLIAFARSDPGRLFNRVELFQAAQGLRVMGAETDKLSEYVQIMSRSVAIGAGTWDELGQVIGRVGSTGQLTGVEFDNLTKMGFALDASLRNTTVTWDELFAALDRGIGQVSGQTETIQGQMTMLSTAVRGLGLAFLQVDSETSQFIEGGLGDQLYQGLGRAREAIVAMQPAAAAFGDAAAIAARGVGLIADAILALPQGLQTTAFVLTGTAGAAMTLGGSLLLLLPRIVETRNALRTLSDAGILTSFGRVAGRAGLVGVALTALTYVGGKLIKNYLDQKQAAEDYAASLSDLEMTLEMVRRQGDTRLAEMGQSAKDLIDTMVTMDRTIEGLGVMYTPGSDEAKAIDEQARAIDQLKDEANLATPVMEKLNEALRDPNIDASAYLEWALGLIEMAAATEEATDDVEVLKEILARPLSDFSRYATEGINNLGQAAEAATAPVQSLFDLFSDLPAALDDLRLDGQGGLARDLEAMSRNIETTFTHLTSPEVFGLGSMGAPWIQALELTEAQTNDLGVAWDRVWKGMQSGVLDNTALMADWNAILADSTLTDEQKVVSLTALSNSLNTYYDSAKAMQQQQVDFLADGANILDWWENYQQAISSGGAAMIESQEQLDRINAALAEQERFAGLVDWAQDINDASAALDQALRTFQQIDSLGQRSSSAESIATTLIGAPGELGELQDLWDRINAGTSDAILSQEAYNQAIASGIAIQESNVRVQDDLNVVRAMQIPLLAEQQLAYERNIGALTQMTAQEQQHALMLQDSGIQAQIAQQYSLAYSASIGEIPKSVVTEMIANTAQADPAMASILEQMGLIEIGAEGEITVNFPDADATIGAINRMTIAFLTFEAAARGVEPYDLAVNIYGEEEAKELFGLLDEHDGTTSTTTLQVKLEGPAGLGQSLGGSIKSLMGIEDTTTLDVKALVTDVDTTAFASLGPVEVPVVPSWQGGVIAGDGTGGAMGAPGMEPIIVPVQGQWNGVIEGLPTSGDGSSIIDGLAQDVEITVTQIGMETVIGLAQATQNAVEGIPASWTTTIGEVGAAGVIGLASATQNAIEDIPASWMTDIRMTGAETAIGLAHSVANAINAIPTSKTSTITTNVVTAYSSTGSPSRGVSGAIKEARLGGVVQELATGGVANYVPFYGAEGNRPELLHFANGGTAPIYTEGVYAVPPMTYVSPANANPGLSGGGDIYLSIPIHGNVYGISDLTQQVLREMVPALKDVIEDVRGGQVSIQ